jgi:t-SNARE complex subunit (syntaxin)
MSASAEEQNEVLDGSPANDGKDTEAGLGHNTVLVYSARKTRWMCFLGILAPLVAITTIVIVVVIIVSKSE